MPLSPELQTRLDILLMNGPVPEAALRALVQDHLTAAEATSEVSPLVDVGLARTLATACLALLDDFATLSKPHQQLVQAACEYFAHTSDDDHDFYSVLGFEDDAALLNHVAHTVGREDVAVEVE